MTLDDARSRGTRRFPGRDRPRRSHEGETVALLGPERRRASRPCCVRSPGWSRLTSGRIELDGTPWDASESVRAARRTSASGPCSSRIACSTTSTPARTSRSGSGLAVCVARAARTVADAALERLGVGVDRRSVPRRPVRRAGPTGRGGAGARDRAGGGAARRTDGRARRLGAQRRATRTRRMARRRARLPAAREPRPRRRPRARRSCRRARGRLGDAARHACRRLAGAPRTGLHRRPGRHEPPAGHARRR